MAPHCFSLWLLLFLFLHSEYQHIQTTSKNTFNGSTVSPSGFFCFYSFIQNINLYKLPSKNTFNGSTVSPSRFFCFYSFIQNINLYKLPAKTPLMAPLFLPLASFVFIPSFRISTYTNYQQKHL